MVKWYQRIRLWMRTIFAGLYSIFIGQFATYQLIAQLNFIQLLGFSLPIWSFEGCWVKFGSLFDLVTNMNEPVLTEFQVQLLDSCKHWTFCDFWLNIWSGNDFMSWFKSIDDDQVDFDHRFDLISISYPFISFRFHDLNLITNQRDGYSLNYSTWPPCHHLNLMARKWYLRPVTDSPVPWRTWSTCYCPDFQSEIQLGWVGQGKIKRSINLDWFLQASFAVVVREVVSDSMAAGNGTLVVGYRWINFRVSIPRKHWKHSKHCNVQFHVALADWSVQLLNSFRLISIANGSSLHLEKVTKKQHAAIKGHPIQTSFFFFPNIGRFWLIQ